MEIVTETREEQADLLVLPTPYRRLNIWDRFFHQFPPSWRCGSFRLRAAAYIARADELAPARLYQ